MVKATVFLYNYFSKHKVALYFILLLSTAFFAYFASKIYFEEDITKLLPSVDKGGTEKLVFSNLKVKDKLFILFQSCSGETDEDGLLEACDNFIQSLIEKDTVYNTINNVLYEIDESLLENGIAYLYENVPAYLDESAYAMMDSLLLKENIEKQMEENYNMLVSSAGSIYKQLIVQDPIGIRNIFFHSMKDLRNGLGGNYTVYNGHIFTPDTTVALAFLSPNFMSFDSMQGTRMIDMVEKEIEQFEKENPDIEVLYHGAPVQSVYNSKRIKMDLVITISISLILIAVILLACYKNKSTLVYLIVPVVYGVLFAMAIMYFIKGSMSLMAMGIGAIVMGVAFSYCLHVITHYKYVSDPVKVLKDQTKPIIMGSLTTIGAFMGLLLTESELLRDFGLFASLGLVGTTFFCLVFLPHFFRPAKNKKSEKAFHIIEKINNYPFEKQKWLIVSIVVVSVVCFIASPFVKFDADLINIGYHEAKVIRSRQLLESKTSDNVATVYFAAVSDNLDSALKNTKALTQELDKELQAGIIKGYSSTSSMFIPTDEQQRRIDLWNNYWTDSRKETLKKNIAQAGQKYRFGANAFTPFYDILDDEYEPENLYDAEVIPAEILDNIIEYADNQYMVFVPVQMKRSDMFEVGSRVADNNPDFLVIDPLYYTANMVEMIHSDFDITLAISSLFVFLVLLVSYRSLTLSLIAFLPMGLSWYIVLGCMAIFGIEFNLINIVISTFIFGIGVDYSIFIMDGLLGKYRSESKLIVYHKTAIFFSAVILIIVTASLLFAVHPAISSIGVSTLIGMGATIIISYSLQPFLFNLLIGKRLDNGKEPFTVSYLFSRLTGKSRKKD